MACRWSWAKRQLSPNCGRGIQRAQCPLMKTWLFPYIERLQRESQRVQLECHYGIRCQKPYHIWFYEPEFHNGTLSGPSGSSGSLKAVRVSVGLIHGRLRTHPLETYMAASLQIVVLFVGHPYNKSPTSLYQGR